MLWNEIIVFKRKNHIDMSTGKVRPKTGHEGREREYSNTSTLSLTSAPDEDVWSTPRPGRFIPGNDPVPIV